jgi:hypothetical protein
MEQFLSPFANTNLIFIGKRRKNWDCPPVEEAGCSRRLIGNGAANN